MANYSAQQGLPTWRYLYAGSFAEVLPYPWVRPYHGSDLVLILGQVRGTSYQDVGPELKKAGKYIQDAVASFVRDPVSGLEGYGWPRYDIGGMLDSLMSLPFSISYDLALLASTANI